MQLTFRIECPHCHWGYKFKNANINKGFLRDKCYHCGKTLFFKIAVTGVQVEVLKELPEGIPCESLLSTNSEDTVAMPTPILPEDALYEKVKQIVANKFNCDIARITLRTHLVKDLNADSLDIIEIIMAFEDAFNIEIPDEEGKVLSTVNKIFNYLLRKTS